MTVLLECRKLTKEYGDKTIFKEIDVTINTGEIISLIGPSGCGKTTLLRTLGGIEFSNGGEVLLQGEDITYQRAEERPIVMMFQQPLLFPHLSVLENISYGLKMKKVDKKTYLRLAQEFLAKIGMDSYASHFPYQLSGGQQQRVSLARALVMKPQVLLLDEPFSSLDPELRGSIRSWVKELLKIEGVTAIFVTHDRDEAMVMGDRVVVMLQGKIQQVGEPLEVYNRPRNQEVAEFYSEGLTIESRSFISVNHLDIRGEGEACDPWQDNFKEFKGRVAGRLMRVGQQIYQVYIEELGREINLSSSKEFKAEDQVIISFNLKDLYHFPDRKEG